MELNHLLDRLKMDHLEAQLDAVCEQALTTPDGLQDLPGPGAANRVAGPLPAWHRSPAAPGAFPLAQNPRPVRLRLPAQPGPHAGARAGRDELRRARPQRDSPGPAGVGKTHLAIALGVKAVEAGYSVLFLTLEALMTRLVKAFNENRLERSLQQLVYPKVLIIDEIGYLPLSNLEASLFFRLVAPPLRTRQPDRHQQQELPGLGRSLQRPGPGHRHPGPPAALLDHPQHQGRKLPAQGKAPGRFARPPQPGSRRRTGGDRPRVNRQCPAR